MIITINNEIKTVENNTTIQDIVISSNLTGKGMAIALNGRIIRRDAWATTHIGDGDNITIIRAAYGG